MIDRFEELVTVFGGGGFIGRYVCEFLMKSGVRVRVAQRNPKQAYIIQPLGQVGQFGFVQADITNRDTVLRALEGASGAVNLVGVFGSKMRSVHVDGARNIAEAASDRGLDALVHVSAIGADPNSPSNYGRTKAEGEDEVRTAFPRATIVRPSHGERRCEPHPRLQPWRFAPPFPVRRLSARRWSSGPRTNSPIVSRPWRGCPSCQ